MSSKQPIATGAALAYSQQMLGGPLVENDGVISVSNAAIVIVDGNGDRVGLVMVNNGGADCYVSIDSAVSASNGIRLSANGGNVSLDVIHDFTMQTRRWYGICPAGGPVNVFFIELYRYSLTQNK